MGVIRSKAESALSGPDKNADSTRDVVAKMGSFQTVDTNFFIKPPFPRPHLFTQSSSLSLFQSKTLIPNLHLHLLPHNYSIT